MDYEKKYKEALERAKNFIENGDERERTIAESIFAGIMEESEDERIRKEIMDIIDSFEVAHLRTAGLPTRIPEYLAWLEKQGEQKPVEWRPSKEVMDVLYSLCYVSDIIDEHKDTVLTKLYQELKREYFNSASYENMFPKEEKIKQSLTKWNEEDDKKLSSIINLTNYAQDTWSKKYMIEVRDWLKSIKDRCLPQPKQEWGEEDEDILDGIIEDIEVLKEEERNKDVKAAYQREIDWLKSLRPQSHWRPSKEQMERLKGTINSLPHQEVLYSLYQDLKKLKG